MAMMMGLATMVALALHGIVFGCFFFLVFITIDEHTTKDVRASAQNMFNLVVFGIGVIVGNILVGVLSAWTKVGDRTDWQMYYSIPAWITLACLVALLIFYPSAKRAGAASAPATAM